MPDRQLMRAFRFRVSLLRSPATGVAAVAASAGLSVSARASIAGSASPRGRAGLSAAVALNAGVGVRASASLGVGGGGVRLGDGGFAECSGLDLEMDVQELAPGGTNNGVVRQVGRAKCQPITLKRGMLFARGGSVDGELWGWMDDVLRGVRPVRRYDGIVEVLGDGDEVVARWRFSRGLPAKLSGPKLDAQTGAIALEELQIAHEGLTLVMT